ncbi:MAG: hypothetical protein GF334_00305, partial [Candidatus Altiarchaeales archaeon]|nr:hypothetical protein [Candidatus Altiarchaeales archaeon]
MRVRDSAGQLGFSQRILYLINFWRINDAFQDIKANKPWGGAFALVICASLVNLAFELMHTMPEAGGVFFLLGYFLGSGIALLFNFALFFAVGGLFHLLMKGFGGEADLETTLIVYGYTHLYLIMEAAATGLLRFFTEKQAILFPTSVTLGFLLPILALIGGLTKTHELVMYKTTIAVALGEAIIIAFAVTLGVLIAVTLKSLGIM